MVTQQAAPARIGTSVKSAPPHARITDPSVSAAPAHTGSSRTAIIIFTHFGTGGLFLKMPRAASENGWAERRCGVNCCLRSHGSHESNNWWTLRAHPETSQVNCQLSELTPSLLPLYPSNRHNRISSLNPAW